MVKKYRGGGGWAGAFQNVVVVTFSFVMFSSMYNQLCSFYFLFILYCCIVTE